MQRGVHPYPYPYPYPNGDGHDDDGGDLCLQVRNENKWKLDEDQ